MGSRNELVTEKNAVDGAWAQVDVALQRRADLIPNLVETVKGFAAQEKAVMKVGRRMRARPWAARKLRPKRSRPTGRSIPLCPACWWWWKTIPNLKSNENFLRLQDELAGTENRIAVERRKYNEVVQQYNTDIEIFPKNIAASMFGFHRNDAYFKAEGAAREAPKVKF